MKTYSDNISKAIADNSRCRVFIPFFYCDEHQLVALIADHQSFCFGTVFWLQNFYAWSCNQPVAMLVPVNKKSIIVEPNTTSILLTVKDIALKQLDHCIGCRVSHDKASHKNSLRFANNFPEAVSSLCALINGFDPIALGTPPENPFDESDWTSCNGCSTWSVGDE